MGFTHPAVPHRREVHQPTSLTFTPIWTSCCFSALMRSACRSVRNVIGESLLNQKRTPKSVRSTLSISEYTPRQPRERNGHGPLMISRVSVIVTETSGIPSGELYHGKIGNTAGTQ